MSKDNSVLMTLAALGVLGLASQARRGGSRARAGHQAHRAHQGSCSRCGVPMSGARNVEEDDPFKDELAPPEWANTTLFFARAADRSGWLTDYDFTKKIVPQYSNVRKLAGRDFDRLVNLSKAGLVDGLKHYAEASSKAADAAMKGRKFPKFNRKELKAQAKKQYQEDKIAAGNAAFHKSDLGRAALEQEMRLKSRHDAYSREREGHGVRPMMSLLFYGEYKANMGGAPRRWGKPVTGGGAASAEKRLAARRLKGLRVSGNLSALKLTSKSLKTNYLVVVIQYLRLLWVKRAWAEYVLGAMKEERIPGATRDGRHAVVKTKLAQEENVTALWENVNWKLAIAGPVENAFATLQNTGSLPRAQVNQVKNATTQQAGLDATRQESPDKDDEETPLPLQVGSPTLRFYRGGRRQTMWWITKNGTLQFEKGRSDVPLLTETSKMASPSFSLPAFTASTGGTCPMAKASDSRMEALAGLRGRKTVICSACYALTSGYAYANVMTDAAGRMDWVKKGLKKGPPFMGGLFATMLASYAIWGRGGKRAKQEIGVWNGKEITRWGRTAKVKNTELGIASYDNKSIPKDTLALFRGTPVGKLAGFFRLHDSGDLFSTSYIRAWCQAAQMMPGVYIWIPTRVWVGSAKAKINDLTSRGRAWYNAWTDGTRKGGKFWQLRGGSAARRRGGRNRLDETPNTVNEQSPGEAGLGDWYLDQDCGTTVLPVGIGKDGFGPSLRYLAALPNVALRPSGLYIKEYPDDPVTIPVVTGLAAGSGVVRKYNPMAYRKLQAFRQVVRQRGLGQRQATGQDRRALAQEHKAFQKQDTTRVLSPRSVTKTRTAAQVADDAERILKYAQLSTMQVGNVPAQEAYQCPVYTEDANGKEMKSCQDAKCRACWILPQLPIFYGAH